jgi:hypothetical protein
LSTPPVVQAQHVFDEDAIADFDVVYEMCIDRAHPPGRPDDRLALADEFIADIHRHAAGAVFIGDLAEPDFRPAQITEHGDRLIPPGRSLADVTEHEQVIIERAVGEI